MANILRSYFGMCLVIGIAIHLKTKLFLCNNFYSMWLILLKF